MSIQTLHFIANSDGRLQQKPLRSHDYVEIPCDCGKVFVFFERFGDRQYEIRGYMLGDTEVKRGDFDEEFSGSFEEHIEIEIEETNQAMGEL